MSYLLDTNVFIQAKNLHYGLDFCPAFWQWLLENSASGRVFSIDKVAGEIAAGGDELTTWAQQVGSGLFRATDATVVAQFGTVSTWAMGQQYEPAAYQHLLTGGRFLPDCPCAVWQPYGGDARTARQLHQAHQDS